MRCEHCPAGWEDGGMTSCGYEVDSCGCLIFGVDECHEDCKLSKTEIKRRLKQLKDYEAGKIDRPQWVANRFMRELDSAAALHGNPAFSYSYPPKRMRKGVYYSLTGSTDRHYQSRADYRHGYEDAQAGKPMKEF